MGHVFRRAAPFAAVVVLGVLAAAPVSSGGRASTRHPTDALPGLWRLAFADEFDGASLDATRWHTCFWWATTTCSIESNHELELYNPDDILVGGGALHLRAQKRELVAWNGAKYGYTSGMVMTGGRKYVKPPGFTFTYGYAEARVRVPKGKGLWPAFWLLPASYDSRPEIDAMEILGDTPNVAHMNFHYVKRDGSNGDSGATWTGPDFSAGWHTFGVDWEPNAIVWYIDGVERWRFSDVPAIPRQPMYLLANLAVGGDWPGSPDAGTPFPSSYDIDYIRVWQRGGPPPRGVTLVPAEATWRYLADGSDQGTAWRAVGFDDSSWRSGPATLGYGQGDEETTVAYGSDPDEKYVTTFFRRSFTVRDPATIRALTLRLRRDDGAIVYLNGREIYRSNMPQGPVSVRTLAYQALDDGSQVHSAAVDRSFLRRGLNTIAVEVHQATRDSSDLTMQLELTATTR